MSMNEHSNILGTESTKFVYHSHLKSLAERLVIFSQTNNVRIIFGYGVRILT